MNIYDKITPNSELASMAMLALILGNLSYSYDILINSGGEFMGSDLILKVYNKEEKLIYESKPTSKAPVSFLIQEFLSQCILLKTPIYE